MRIGHRLAGIAESIKQFTINTANHFTRVEGRQQPSRANEQLACVRGVSDTDASMNHYAVETLATPAPRLDDSIFSIGSSSSLSETFERMKQNNPQFSALIARGEQHQNNINIFNRRNEQLRHAIEQVPSHLLAAVDTDENQKPLISYSRSAPGSDTKFTEDNKAIITIGSRAFETSLPEKHLLLVLRHELDHANKRALHGTKNAFSENEEELLVRIADIDRAIAICGETPPPTDWELSTRIKRSLTLARMEITEERWEALRKLAEKAIAKLPND